jgi:phosphoserine phosphatase
MKTGGAVLTRNQALIFMAALVSLSSGAEEIGWRPEVTRAIDQVLARHPPSEKEKPIAVFDWDNTTAKNVIGDAVFFTMLEKDMIFVPPEGDLRLVTSYFSEDAIAAIKSSCKQLERKKKSGYLLPGRFYKTSGADAKDCRLEFMNFYMDEKTSAGKPAFDQSPTAYNRRAIKPSYLWITLLFSGMTQDDVIQLSNEVIDSRSTAEVKARRTQLVDGALKPTFLEIYEPIVELMDKLLRGGFEVWIVSASQQYVVETFARRLDQKLQGRLFKQDVRNYLETDQRRQNVPVIGVQVQSEKGDRARQILNKMGVTYDGDSYVLINRASGCGEFGENQVITYVEGKSCFINKGIQKRPVIAAGDANTDISMLQMASELAIVVNRNYDELMCNAYQSRSLQKKWVVQPMFIDPCPKREKGYECRCKAPDGLLGPCINEGGDFLASTAQDQVFVASGSGKKGLDCH